MKRKRQQRTERGSEEVPPFFFFHWEFLGSALEVTIVLGSACWHEGIFGRDGWRREDVGWNGGASVSAYWEGLPCSAGEVDRVGGVWCS